MSNYTACGDPNAGFVAQTVGPVFPLIVSPGISITGNTSSYYVSHPTMSDHEILLKRVEAIEERLLILQPNQALQDKYPALQEAYDAYKIIEKLVK